MTKDVLTQQMTKRFGMVKRARGCFLYTERSVRLTDLYQEGGRAILGWGGGSALTVFKNVLDRKIIGTFDTAFSPQAAGGKSQLSRAVSALLSGERNVFVFNAEADAAQFAERVCGDVCFYVPWNGDGIDWREQKCVLVRPPFPFGDTLTIVAVRPKDCAAASAPGSQFRIPAPLCAAVTRALYDLIAELPRREEKHWFVYDTVLRRYWTRTGPYLFPNVDEAQYDDFVLHCLDCNLVISPTRAVPSIVPFGADKGNFSALAKSPFGGA